jgi:hypothetical protein
MYMCYSAMDIRKDSLSAGMLREIYGCSLLGKGPTNVTFEDYTQGTAVPRKPPVLNIKQQTRNGCKDNEFGGRETGSKLSSCRSRQFKLAMCSSSRREPEIFGRCVAIIEVMDSNKCRPQCDVSQSSRDRPS